ncbi:MAG: ABC transporter ATP-binding protein [Fusobacterium necrophorum]|nr:ABC transporter ATP-binding protein [Fusobacterium necrophorum]
MKILIQVEQGYFSYPKQESLLRNINFSIREGEFTAIIGANGAGKTTFLKLLLEQLSFQKGKVTRNYRQISYVSQAQDKMQEAFPATVMEVVLLNLWKKIGYFHFVKEAQRQEARKALKMVGMEAYEKHLMRELSGGQRQRVMIAKAIVQEPELLILDEPTTGLDKKAVEDLFDTLTKLQHEKGMSILMISHDLFRVRTWCEHIYLLEEGELYASV